MDISKIIPVILVVIILIVGGFALSFYNTNNKLKEEKAKLEEENTRLFQDRKDLQEKAARLEREISDLKSKKEEVEQALSKAQEERDALQAKYNELLKEREALVEKLSAQQKVVAEEVSPKLTVSTTTPTSEEYWVDFVKIKAQLEAKVDSLNKELLDTKNKLAELDKTNKELEIKIDELTKEKERLTNEIAFKERTLSIMSRDLVSEREARSVAVEELNKLRSQNTSLKRELILANKEKMQLTNNIKEAIEKKQSLEKKVAEIDRILREKSITLEELQEEFRTAIKEQPQVISRESAAVQLPPIVVKPQATATLKGLKGEVIAVNQEERFIIVNLGEKNGARIGMQLAIYRGDKQIGSAEIIEVRSEICAADIKEVLSGFTINKGDTVMAK